MELTRRQDTVLELLRRTLAENGLPPTLAEMADELEIGINAVTKHLRALEKKGCIELLPGRARGIRLLDDGLAGDLLALPLIGRVAAGRPILSEAQIERDITVDRWLFRPRPDYLLRVHGESMVDDGIFDGDLIGVHRTPAAEHGQIVIARVGDEGFTVKRLHHHNGELRLMPRSAGHRPIDPDPYEEFAIEGLFCGLVRPGT